ncbi:MAG: helix-turn-helix transcriptional regulator [Spirochaetes bacterium]|nr:helix-turn-helix transcriptional regulator [Spirochaetota bacterium]
MLTSYYIILFGASFTLLHGIEQIVAQSKRTRLDYLTALVMLDVALILYNHAILSTDRLITHKNILFFYLTSLYAIGPLNYLYYYSLINRKYTFSFRLGIHLIPAACMFVLETIFLLSPAHIKNEIVTIMYSEKISFFTVLLFVGGLIFIMYQLYFIYQCSSVLYQASKIQGLYVALFLESVNVLTPLPIVLWFITKHHYLYAIASYMTIVVIVVLFLFHRRFPSLFETLADAIRKEKYERDYLSGMDIPQLIKRLYYLMDTEKIFLEPTITLAEMSQKLQITPHQLSQLLNEHCKMRFNHFINRYRIEEAKKILLNEKDANIISVAFHVGFNSKSSFNKIFKQYTGITPSEYKMQNKL